MYINHNYTFSPFSPSPPFSTHSIEKRIFTSLFNKHRTTNFTYNTNTINDIIYNEKTHIVAVFKDYLILDDISEFLKRYYTSIESSIRLPRFLDYYTKYSRIFPNYTTFNESKYIYKNIHKKQKMIDQQHNNVKHNTVTQNDSDDKVFSTEVCNSLVNDSSYMNYLFGLKRNDKKYNTVNSKDDNNTNININIDNVLSSGNDSVMNVNKIISLINELEHKHNKLLSYMQQQRNINNNNITTTTHVTSLKPKHPTLLINSNKYGFINTQHINISKKNDYKEKHINLSHRGSFFSSSYTKRVSHNNNKKNYNTNITNHAVTNRTSSKPTSKDYGGICFTINTSTNKKSPQTDRFKHKIKEILIKNNIHINSNNTSRNRYHHRQRNHNCLLNSKGLMFNSKTNNTIYYSNINKQQQFITLSTRNKQVDDGNGSSSSNTRNKKVNANSKSVFDFDLLRKYITISQSKSKSKHNNNNNNNKSNNHNIKERYKLNSGIINSNNILLPINNKIPGIKIKGFNNKLLEYPSSYHTIKTHHTPTSKLSNINRKLKYNNK